MLPSQNGCHSSLPGGLYAFPMRSPCIPHAFPMRSPCIPGGCSFFCADFPPFSFPVKPLTQEEMTLYAIPGRDRDYCAHLWVERQKCFGMHAPRYWECNVEKKRYQRCNHERYVFARVRARVRVCVCLRVFVCGMFAILYFGDHSWRRCLSRPVSQP